MQSETLENLYLPVMKGSKSNFSLTPIAVLQWHNSQTGVLPLLIYACTSKKCTEFKPLGALKKKICVCVCVCVFPLSI